MIKVYTKPLCPYCDMAKDYLQTQAVIFEEINVMEDSDALSFIKGKGHRTVPQIYNEDELLVEGGYTGLVKLGREGLLEAIG
jgi:glutaredoxin